MFDPASLFYYGYEIKVTSAALLVDGTALCRVLFSD